MVNLIAEIGINHNGDVAIAANMMHAAASAGFNAVKFQKRTVELVYTEDELNLHRDSPWGTTNRDQKHGLELSLDDYRALYQLAKELKIEMGFSCWDLESFHKVEEAGVCDFHKVASARLLHYALLDCVVQAKKPFIVSTGMSTDDEVFEVLEWFRGRRVVPTAVLACTSTYPTIDEEVNLAYITRLQRRFPGRIGFSNHQPDSLASVGAVALGATCIETHVTLDRSMYGSDQSASIEDMHGFVQDVRRMEALLGDGQKRVYESELPIRKKLARS